MTAYQAELTWRLQVRLDSQPPVPAAASSRGLRLVPAGQQAPCRRQAAASAVCGSREWATGPGLDSPPARARVASLQFGVAAVICFCVTLYRWLYLEESEVWQAEHAGVQQELRDEKDPAAVRPLPRLS